MNVTVPVGVPDPGVTALTVAVKVTACPKTDGFAEELSAVVVDAWFTTWLSADEVLALKDVLPLYDAVTAWVPTLKVDVEKLA